MTYKEWEEVHNSKRRAIQLKLEKQGFNKNDIIEYFNYDNMIEKEPNFCLLYSTGTKCHNIDNLNCYLCGCPYFLFHENPIEKDGKKINSICTINSKFSCTFEYEDNIHCDCSNCIIPHNKNTALKFYEDLNVFIDDSCSLLENIRNWQLFDIFGKFKIF